MSLVSQLGDLRSRVAIITGASSGVGRATALAFAELGVRVVVTARRTERLDALVEQIQTADGEALAVAGDAAAMETATAGTDAALTHFDRIDILVANAGIGMYRQLVDTSLDDFDSMMSSNVRSGFVFARAVVPHMIAHKRGTIVFVSSVAGVNGAANEAVYSATKFAQVGFAQSLGEELRPHGIQVTALCPGGIKTAFAVGFGRTEASVAASNMMDAGEVADAIVFACLQPPSVRIPQMIVRHL